MEPRKIVPGKPMDNATWVKYLRQENISGSFALLGKSVRAYDIKFIISNQKKGNVNKNIVSMLFGNYFDENPKAESIAMVSGEPHHQKSMLVFINAPYESVKKDACALEVVETAKGNKVSMAKIDKQKLANDFLKLTAAYGRKINAPRKEGATVHIECSFTKVPGKPYMILNIEKEDRYEDPSKQPSRGTRAGRNSYTESVRIVKMPDTNIVDMVRAAVKKGERFEIDITPIMAEDLLTINAKNRHIRNADIFKYAALMEEGKWYFTSQSALEINTEGELINGQHRLWAQIKSGVTVHWMIWCGTDKDAFKHLDSGRPRTAGDTLSVRRLPDANQAAATVTYFLTVKKLNRTLGKGAISNLEIDEWISIDDNYRALKEALLLGYTIFKKHGGIKLLSLTLFTGLYLLFREKHRADAEEFMTRLVTAENIGRNESSSIYLLNRRLTNWNTAATPDKIPKGSKATDQKTRYAIAAWNMYRLKDKNGRPLVFDKLKIDPFEKELPKINR